MISEGAGLFTVSVSGLHEAKTQSPVRANKTGTHCAYSQGTLGYRVKYSAYLCLGF